MIDRTARWRLERLARVDCGIYLVPGQSYDVLRSRVEAKLGTRVDDFGYTDRTFAEALKESKMSRVTIEYRTQTQPIEKVRISCCQQATDYAVVKGAQGGYRLDFAVFERAQRNTISISPADAIEWAEGVIELAKQVRDGK